MLRPGYTLASVVRAGRGRFGQEGGHVAAEADHAIVGVVAVAGPAAAVWTLAPMLLARRALGLLRSGAAVALRTPFRTFAARGGFLVSGCGFGHGGRFGRRRTRL